MTLELLAFLKDQYDIILLAFPGEERHYEIEDLVYGVRYDKCCKIFNTFLFLFSNKMWVFRAVTQKMLVRKANREDPDQTALSEAV